MTIQTKKCTMQSLSALKTWSTTIMSFQSLNLSDPILRALAEHNYKTPTAIQSKAIPAMLDGKDLLGGAQTGTGKTASFAIPVIETLLKKPNEKKKVIRALILIPTRELADQVGKSFIKYGKHTSIN